MIGSLSCWPPDRGKIVGTVLCYVYICCTVYAVVCRAMLVYNEHFLQMNLFRYNFIFCAVAFFLK